MAAGLGYAEGQCLLGCYLLYGVGVAQDAAAAVGPLKQAADQGYADAENKMGLNYMQGRGVEQDLDEAVFWWERAAEHGSRDAQGNLENLYGAFSLPSADEHEARVSCHSSLV